jgi:hypothetical protein
VSDPPCSTQIELLMAAFLPIMLLTEDVLGRPILRGMEAGSFLFRHHPIGFGFVLHLVDMLLLLVQLVRFALSQLTARNPLIDSQFLVGLPLINTRRLSLSIGHASYQ